MARRFIWGFMLLALGALEFCWAGAWLWSASGRELVPPPWLPLAWPPDWPLLLAGHVFLVLLSALCVRVMYPGQRGRSMAMITFLTALFFPVAGLFCLAVIIILQPGMARRADLVNQFKHNISIQSDSDRQQVRVQDVVEYLADQVNVAPLADLVRSEDPALRRGAISALRKIKNPTAVKLLKQARGDPSPEMRVHAHVALTRLDNEMSDGLARAMKLAELTPEDTEALAGQARAAMDYLLSGLLEDAAMDHYLNLAKEPLNQVLAKEPHHPHALAMLGRLHLIGGDPAGARRAYQEFLQRHGPDAEVYLGLSEALYQLGEYSELAKAAVGYRQEASAEKPDRQALAATELWIA